jgi:hypothetical protein
MCWIFTNALNFNLNIFLYSTPQIAKIWIVKCITKFLMLIPSIRHPWINRLSLNWSAEERSFEQTKYLGQDIISSLWSRIVLIQLPTLFWYFTYVAFQTEFLQILNSLPLHSLKSVYHVISIQKEDQEFVLCTWLIPAGSCVGRHVLCLWGIVNKDGGYEAIFSLPQEMLFAIGKMTAHTVYMYISIYLYACICV